MIYFKKITNLNKVFVVFLYFFKFFKYIKCNILKFGIRNLILFNYFSFNKRIFLSKTHPTNRQFCPLLLINGAATLDPEI